MWKTVKLGDVCELATGGTPSRKKKEYFENGNIKWLVSGDINQREIYDCEGRITDEGLANSNAKYLPENSVLIALNGQGKTRGTVALLRTKATCNQSLVSINPKTGVALDTKFLFYVLDGMYGKIRTMTGDSGNDRRGLNMPLIRSIEIPLPPLAEQQRIVAKLDAAFAEIDRAVDATTRAIAQAKIGLGNLIDEKTSNRADWKEYKVADLGLVQTGNTPKTSEKANYGSEIAFIKPPYFRTDGTIEIVEDGLSATGAKSSRKASANSVMMVCIGATIGKVAVCHEEVCFNQQINALSPVKEYDAELIYWQMRGTRFQREVRERAGQATLPIISKAKWANLKIYLPSSNEAQVQIRIQLRRLSDKTEEYCSFKASKIDKLQQLKSAILAQELQPPQSEAA